MKCRIQELRRIPRILLYLDCSFQYCGPILWPLRTSYVPQGCIPSLSITASVGIVQRQALLIDPSPLPLQPLFASPAIMHIHGVRKPYRPFLPAAQKRPLRYPTCESPPGHIIPGGHECKFNLTYDLEPCPLPDRGGIPLGNTPAFILEPRVLGSEWCEYSGSILKPQARSRRALLRAGGSEGGVPFAAVLARRQLRSSTLLWWYLLLGRRHSGQMVGTNFRSFSINFQGRNQGVNYYSCECCTG